MKLVCIDTRLVFFMAVSISLNVEIEIFIWSQSICYSSLYGVFLRFNLL